MVNEVRLQGRITAATERVFPSGDVVVVFRLVVPRKESGRVDTIDCRVESARLRRQALRFAEHLEVEVVGALHRRFWRGAGGPASRYEVLATSLHRVPNGPA